MQERYGLDRRPVGRWVGVGVLTAVFVAVVGFVTISLSGARVDARLVTWDDVAADRVDMRIEVRRPAGTEVTCILRAQDEHRIDVGYATLVLPPGDDRIVADYALRTLAPAYTAELLGCGIDGPPSVPPPQFPPGVVPPAQPYA
jgi:hypothetical protein